jgi:hypothetical protein
VHPYDVMGQPCSRCGEGSHRSDEDDTTCDWVDLAVDGDNAAGHNIIGRGEEENLRVLEWGTERTRCRLEGGG